ncbi:zona pellucida sperm-binding protein 3-like [Colossoma macropomum]|uniref:zona pellucida sperm-binding protein 3-like n=1 Tax=Colossoma macropomum TaxID=42526 RepID=UPI001864F09A|nr:zona pellucida sperm-binding protein 3-like [Colossoma macropomum]
MEVKPVGLGVLLLVLLGSCSAHLPKWRRPSPHQPQQIPGRGPVQQAGARLPLQDPVSGVLVNPEDPLSVQLKQVMQGPVKKLTWRFPQAPEKPKQPEVYFEPRQPVSVVSVAADCGENSVYVEVKKDLFGTGELINPSALSLGGCAATGEDSAAQVLIFEAELQLCNSVLTTTADELVYSFILQYASEPLGGMPILRTGGAMVAIECHYPRLHNVSSNALLPAWIPYASTVTAEERLVFSLRLMTDDWQFERPSNQYFLGDLINIEASVMQYNHVPLRIFVDSCVATAAPDANAVPRYSFIENYGCLVDAKLTGSTSRFLPRVQADKLQFQLEAFVFQQQSSDLIYLTCFLKATSVSASAPTDAVHKACSFTANRWTTADDDDRVCGCCDTSCGLRDGGSASPVAGPQWEGNISVGPVRIGEKFPVWQRGG